MNPSWVTHIWNKTIYPIIGGFEKINPLIFLWKIIKLSYLSYFIHRNGSGGQTNDSNQNQPKWAEEKIKKNLQCKKWFEELECEEERFSPNKKELKNHVQECYRKGKWTKLVERKQQY